MTLARIATASALLALAAPPGTADGLEPGSVLVFPVHRTGIQEIDLPGAGTTVLPGTFFTLVSVTNTDLEPVTPLNGLGGSTNIHWEYVNVTPDPDFPNRALSCQIQDRVDFLTPGDTRPVLTNCENPPEGNLGYLVVSAQDPNAFDRPWSHNHLVGSEIVFQGGMSYTLNAIPFDAIEPDGAETDLDLDGELDFDGLEYEGVPDHHYLDLLIADGFSQSVAFINLSGGTAFTATVALDVWNDNEQALSATLSFKCWADEFLANVSQVFAPGFLAANTQHDPNELDVTCDGQGDLETAWARVRGLTNSSAVESYPNPAILVAHTRNVLQAQGRRAWESVELQTNGDFLKTGTNDVEFP